MASEEWSLSVSQDRLRDVIEHVQVLAADADTQNTWLHPCGWTRQEPYEHTLDQGPCLPIAELADSFTDMWPTWKPILIPVLSAEGVHALDRLGAALRDLDEDAFVDELSTLDCDGWANVRRVATETLSLVTPL